MRLDLDVRRKWRCSACGTERRTPGDRTVLHCSACADRPLMTLVEPERPPRHLAPRLDLIIGVHPDDVGLPPALPRERVTEAEPKPAETPEEPAASPEPSSEQTPQTNRSGKRSGRRRSRRKPAESVAEPPSDTSAPASQPTPESQALPPTETSRSEPNSFGDGVLEG